MSARALIDSLSFARVGGRLSGSYPLAELPRLEEILHGVEGGVDWQLEGLVRDGRPCLRVTVSGRLELVCQRCLKPYPHELRSETLMPLARSEAELAGWEREDPLLDCLLADSRLDVQMLVEDEILLSLPAVPKHPDPACGKAA
jgi:DUF177 domain-containing protein